MRTVAALTALLAVVTPTLAFAEPDWFPVARAEGQPSISYIDRASIHRTGSIVRYWQRVDAVNDPNKVKQYIALAEEDCEGGRERTIQVTAYLINGTSFTSDHPGEWSYATPGTTGENVKIFVCEK